MGLKLRFKMGFKKPAKLPFRDRSREPMRLEGFADAVIGFAVTLAVVSLDVPRTSGDLILLVRGVLSFAITFAILVGIWHGHHRWCRRYGLDDDVTIVWTAVLLFVAVFYTYPLKFLMSATFDPFLGAPAQVLDASGQLVDVMQREHVGLVLALYGLGYGLVQVVFWALYRHAWQQRGPLQLDDAEQLETGLMMRTYRDAGVFSLVFMGMWPVMQIPRGVFRIAGLLGYFVVMLVALFVFTQGMRRSTRERERWLAGGNASTEGK